MEVGLFIDEHIEGDYLIRTIAGHGTIRALAVQSTKLCEKARELHDMSPTATAALGRTLTAAALMSSFLKGRKNSVTIQIKGDGPLEGIVAVTDFDGYVRGYVGNPGVDTQLKYPGKLDVGAVVGKNGRLTVIKDLGLREPYIGSVNLVSGEIAEDLSYYYAISEQVPSIVALGVLIGTDGKVEQAGGFLIQLLPDAPESVISFLEDKLKTMEPVTKSLAQNKTPEVILEEILGQMEITLLEKRPVGYRCNCSREKMEKNLIALGEKEIRSILMEDRKAQLQCHFCNNHYNFEEEELKNILEIAK